ncbi:MAG: PAS domain-containing sensor histidine kinase [Anaerolineae bacterium]|nr:PAS domain-containing sensor histidine kinase [Anaerolineae bacterium]
MTQTPDVYWHAHRRIMRHRSQVPIWAAVFPQQSLRTFLEEMWDGLMIIADDQVAYVNDQLCEMLGYSRAELTGMPGGMFPVEWPGLRVLFDALRADSDREIPSGDLEFEIVRKDGVRRWVFARYAIHCEDDDCRMAFVVMTDITERREAMEEREQLIRDLSTFAQTVAHGLKSPLTLVRASAEVLAVEGPVAPGSEFYPYLDTILRGEQVMRNMIQELLLLAGVSNQQVETRPLAMDSIVRSALERLAIMTRDYGAVVSVTANLPTALGYAPWIEEVWVNYISNAIKYGGTPPRLHLGATVKASGWVHFWVRDNGIGLTEEEQSQLFRPFKRLTQKAVSGEGLGLSIVAQILERLGGRVTLRALLEGGNEFGFVLPNA